MQFKLTLVSNSLSLLLMVVLIKDRVYLQWYHHELKPLYGYAEIVLVIVLILLYTASIFYKYVKK
jgi:hypothetical protein